MDDPNSPEAWYRRLPPITKWMATGTFLCTLLFVLELLPASLLILDMRLVVTRLHLWRLLSNYLFLGPFRFSWIIQMYLFCQFSAKLEKAAIFEDYVSSYLYFLLFQMLSLDLFSVCVAYPRGLAMMAPSLNFAILYYWSRREPYAQVGLWGFSIEAYKFPFILMVLDVMLGNSVIPNILGLLSGHLYYFLRELLPAERGYNLLGRPPIFLDKLMNKLLSLGQGSNTTRQGSNSSSGQASSGGSQWGAGAGTSTLAGDGATSGGARFWGSGHVTQRREFSGPGYRLGGGE